MFGNPHRHSAASSVRATSRSPPLVNPNLAVATQQQQQQHQEPQQSETDTSNRTSFQSNRLFRLTSNNTSTTTTSKYTAFYSAQSQFSTSSFHTAQTERLSPPFNPDSGETIQSTELAAMNFGKKPSLEQQREIEDADLVHAMARQYVIDAEAAGSATPGSHRSRMTLKTDQEKYPMPEPHSRAGPAQPGSLQHQSMASQQDSEIGVGQLSDHRYYPGQAAGENNASASESAGPEDRRTMDEEEFEDDANEARHFVPTRMRYPAPKYEIRTDAQIPLGAMLFVAGFLVLPFWWLGVVLPRKQDSEVARTWRKYNSLMTLLSLPLLGLFLALGGWHATH